MPLRGVMTGGGDASAGNTAASLVLTYPTGGAAVQVGDVMICTIVGSTGTNTVSTPTGWTLLSGPQISGSTATGYVFGKTAVLGDIGGTVTLTWSTASRTVAAGIVLQGGNLATVIVGTPVVQASNTALTEPTITTTAASTDVVEILLNRIGSGTPPSPTWPAGWTRDVDAKQASAGVNESAAIAHLTTPGAAGSYGGQSVTFTSAGPTIGYTLGIPPVVAGTAYTASPADTEGLTDAAATAVDAQRPGTDLAGITDATALDRATAAADLAGLSDAATPAQGFTRSPADTAGLTDAAAAALGLGNFPADTAGLTDAATAQIGLGNSPADVVGLTDAASTTAALARTVADTAGLTDSVTAALDKITTAGDLLGAIDTAQARLDRATSPTDQAGLSDAASAVLGQGRAAADALALTDSVTAVTSIEVFISDQMALVDHGYRERYLRLRGTFDPPRFSGEVAPGRFTATVDPTRLSGTVEENP